MGYDEAARMPTKVTGRNHQLLCEFQGEDQTTVFGVEIELTGVPVWRLFDHDHMPEDRALMTNSGRPSALPTSRMAPVAL